MIRAALVADRSTPVAPPAAPPAPIASHTSTDLSGAQESWVPTMWWGLAALAVGLGWWLVFHRHRSLLTWFVGAIPFLVVLFVFYVHVERLLPTNY